MSDEVIEEEDEFVPRPTLTEWLEEKAVTFIVDKIYGNAAFLGEWTGAIFTQEFFDTIAGETAATIWQVFSFAVGTLYATLNFWYLLQLRVFLKSQSVEYKLGWLDPFKVMLVSVSDVIADNFQF